ncbi:hypothetical protein H4Q26_016219 [Puccinia striiformis f. sp. tritici PST-130]|nr:hypothetical protein H4Q26_016219 [Puccinia striiformis f. sp. tritici PST-130]
MADMLEWFVVIGGVGLVLTAFRARSRTIARKKFLGLPTSDADTTKGGPLQPILSSFAT